ncbi:hypothetical protein EX30DRAFT_372128 [Ascodesmis nigricans]|uniref:Glycine cleavage system H protein n=1 Tax=Ascodesmis nigricans TaxID=341454 RepID=A0A4S2MVE2_9PEZI|nr:hypothetical protein EX30DRAFT_372128 [Ascodesmis nigricans]
MASVLRPLLRTRAPAAFIRSSFAARSISTTPRLSEILKRYTKEHEWVTLDTSSSVATIGITQHAADALGDVVYIELPAVEDQVTESEPFGAVESVKSASDILSPVSGEVVEKNEAIEGKPGDLNKDPEGEGWLVKVKVEGGEEIVEGLMEQTAYEDFCKQD